VSDAPKLSDHLDEDSSQHFAKLKSILDKAGIVYSVNPNLVRGLDYYCKTVFEWITDELGAQGTICAGGRYDGLVAQLGGKETPAAGFAIGLERLISLLDDAELFPAMTAPDLYIIMLGDEAEIEGMILAENLRRDHAGLKVLTGCSGGSLKNQLKKADKSGAEIALILGEEEIKSQRVNVKYLRQNKEQHSVALDKLNIFLQDKQDN